MVSTAHPDTSPAPASLVAHADWSIDPRKRWVAVARRTGVVSNLIADIETKMARGAQSQGARELAAAF